ncbi:MAG TPA: DUF177 domain-containing protein [Clostridiaceae bacterium]|nr:DUF177 domain-containing protein [Clostridiaceae bacterium]
MIINVSDILKINGASLNVEFSEKIEGLETNDNGLVFDSPVSFKGKLTNEKGTLRLNGYVDLQYKVKCYRCLKDLERNMSFDLNERFVSSNNIADSDVYTYNGNYVDTDKAIKDNIILNLPMKHICDVGCRGLCPKCGTNLNERECNCREDDINPRMEALKNFFSDKNNE